MTPRDPRPLALSSGKTLAKNSSYNLIGQGLPVVAAILSIPLIIAELGTEGFGALALAWIFIGYFGIFDFGLGRAITKLMAEKFGQNREQDIPGLFWTAVILMMGMGILGGGVLWYLSEWLTFHVLEVSDGLKVELFASFQTISLAIPAITTATGFRGALEARQEFKSVNIIRLAVGLLTYLGPLGALALSKNLQSVVMILVVGRVLALGGYAMFCKKSMPFIFHKFCFDPAAVLPLLRFGGWMTAANLAGPLMVYADRFLIGSLLSVSMVAYYTTPYDMATKLWIIPGALIGVLLPAFSTAFARDNIKFRQLFRKSIKYIYLIMFPLCLFVVAYSFELLKIWINNDFAANSFVVMNIIVVGVFINSLAQVCFVMLQAAGRPDITFKILLVQLPFYFAALYFCTNFFGIAGAALAWILRVTVDSFLFFYYAKKIDSALFKMQQIFAKIALFSLLSFIAVYSANTFLLKSAVYLVSMLSFAIIMYGLLDQEEKNLARTLFQKLRTVLTCNQ